MDSFEEITTEGQTTPDAQPQKKEWVTPTFEQVALKKALDNLTGDISADLSTSSS